MTTLELVPAASLGLTVLEQDAEAVLLALPGVAVDRSGRGAGSGRVDRGGGPAEQ